MKFDYGSWLAMLASKKEVTLGESELSLLREISSIMAEMNAESFLWRSIADQLAAGFTVVCECNDHEQCPECKPLDDYLDAVSDFDEQSDSGETQ